MLSHRFISQRPRPIGSKLTYNYLSILRKQVLKNLCFGGRAIITKISDGERFQNRHKMSSDEEDRPRKRLKVLKLKGGDMTVKYVGLKNRGDKEMIVELQFCFHDKPLQPKIVGELCRNIFPRI